MYIKLNLLSRFRDKLPPAASVSVGRVRIHDERQAKAKVPATVLLSPAAGAEWSIPWALDLAE